MWLCMLTTPFRIFCLGMLLAGPVSCQCQWCNNWYFQYLPDLTGYFVVLEPRMGSEWQNDRTHLVRWTKGLLDGIDSFDVEILRLSVEGLYYVARDGAFFSPTSCARVSNHTPVPTKGGALNLAIRDVPIGDDYFLVFLNSTHGLVHATSSRFSITPFSAENESSSQQPDPDWRAATVTVSGVPNPTVGFLTTFSTKPNEAVASNSGRYYPLGCILLLLPLFLAALQTI